MKKDILQIVTDVYTLKFLIAVAVFYTLDFITGFVRAWRMKNIQSNKMRQGAEKAVIYFAFISIGFVVDFIASKHIATCVCCSIVCGIELLSLKENFAAWNLEIPEFINIFKKNVGDK